MGTQLGAKLCLLMEMCALLSHVTHLILDIIQLHFPYSQAFQITLCKTLGMFYQMNCVPVELLLYSCS